MVGGNVLHHVQNEGNCPGGGNVRGTCPGDMSGSRQSSILMALLCRVSAVYWQLWSVPSSVEQKKIWWMRIHPDRRGKWVVQSAELKRWIATECWERNERSLSSRDCQLSLRPRTMRSSVSVVDKLKVPRCCIAIGWKMWLGKRLAYFSDFLSAAISAIWRPFSTWICQTAAAGNSDIQISSFRHAMLRACAAYAVVRCPPVRPCVLCRNE